MAVIVIILTFAKSSCEIIMKMRPFIIFLLTSLLLISCNPAPYHSREVESSLVALDRVLDKTNEIRARKEARIDSLRVLCNEPQDEYSLYHIYDAIFNEYHKWNVDSAYSYAQKKIALAEAIKAPQMIGDAKLDLASQSFLSSSYLDAIATMNDIDTSAIATLGRLPEYRYLWYEIYHGLVQTTKNESLALNYRQNERACLDLCDQYIKSDCIEYYVTKAKVMIPQDRSEEIISLIRRKLSNPSISIYNKARLHYWIGRAYNALGDEDNAMIHYATSAQYDFIIPLKTYGSAFSLARLCFKRGDIKRAFRYIMFSYTNAMDMEDNMHINRIAKFIPSIITQHEQYVAKNRRFMAMMIAALVALAVILTFAIRLLVRNVKHLDNANIEIAKTARHLQETNHIKDIYLGEFLSMFSEHINGIERYRSSLRKVSKQMDFEAIQQKLRSDDFIDSEWSYLHRKFDKTFLGLFPNFIEEVNALLKTDKHLGEDAPKGKLSNELRVLALMRLGVSEPARISQFLRLSPTTVYNYRVKLRNAALCSKEEFESKIMNIGR